MQKARLTAFHRALACALLMLAALPGTGLAGTPVDPPVIEFGDTTVTRSQLDARFEIAARLLARRQGVSLADQDAAAVAMLRQQYLDKHATELVLLDEARRRQLLVSDAQVDVALGELFGRDAEIDALLAELPSAAGSDRELLEQIVREGQTIELLTEQMLREIKIPTGDVITLHHDVKHALATPEEVCVRHVQLAHREEAMRVLAELQTGADFDDLAAERSTDRASAAAGGDIGCFERGPAGPRTEFERAAFAAEEDDLVGPVESRFGFHVLLVYEHRMPREPTLNEAYAQIERELALEQLPERMRALLESSGVRVYADRYAD